MKMQKFFVLGVFLLVQQTVLGAASGQQNSREEVLDFFAKLEPEINLLRTYSVFGAGPKASDIIKTIRTFINSNAKVRPLLENEVKCLDINFKKISNNYWLLFMPWRKQLMYRYYAEQFDLFAYVAKQLLLVDAMVKENPVLKSESFLAKVKVPQRLVQGSLDADFSYSRNEMFKLAVFLFEGYKEFINSVVDAIEKNVDLPTNEVVREFFSSVYLELHSITIAFSSGMQRGSLNSNVINRIFENYHQRHENSFSLGVVEAARAREAEEARAKEAVETKAREKQVAEEKAQTNIKKEEERAKEKEKRAQQAAERARREREAAERAQKAREEEAAASKTVTEKAAQERKARELK